MFIECRLGQTRFVVLIGTRAYKIGRFRPFRFLARFLFFPFSKRRREHFRTKYGSLQWIALFNDVCAGLVANRSEFHFYMSRRDNRTIPSISTYFWGWLITQERSLQISDVELSRLKTHIALRCEHFPEARHPNQYGVYRGAVVLVDYADPQTHALLSTVWTI